MSELIRPIHSFKGAEQFISQQGLSLLAFQLEERLNFLTKDERPDSGQVMELFLLSRNLISRLTEDLESMQLRVW
jgi:chemotaxis protein histidine kinase CheA